MQEIVQFVREVTDAGCPWRLVRQRSTVSRMRSVHCRQVGIDDLFFCLQLHHF